MSRQIPPATPEINRLRAAAALIPIIENGLTQAKLSVERAAGMASFCEWTIRSSPQDPAAVKLAETVVIGMQRIRRVLSAGS
ncbi:MAG TPA: hypothetical protein PLO14_00340 [Accumulibacter sp.]|uniref:hypothetical protein n=1 Tax=Accumulibacter sp. TaxID=2053492 RepID=UPI0025D661D0|nr:hypothetical protein [Accumulibacter sp.]MCM8597867.1 hypothetical protein [Accumulibacter sp.]MCM8663352.1 hypothetical protein [Accumulibacter sp.]HNC50674.1 hypothetical protein [Accumulibacter sp.]